MGVLTEILVAHPDQASSIKASLDRQDWHAVDMKGHSELTLSALWCVLDRSKSIETAETQFTLLTENDAEGPWVFAIPNELTLLIADVPDEAVEDIHQQWCQDDEMEVDDERDARAVLEQLRDLIRASKQAVSRDTSLLMWVCL